MKNNLHLSAPAETAALLRREAAAEPYCSTTRVIGESFPSVTVTGIDDATLAGLVMRAVGHVIIYQFDLPYDEQRVRIAHALAHLIYDGNYRVAACTHVPDEEERAHTFVDELFVPLEELHPYVWRWPDNGMDTLYRDQLHMIGARFGVPTRYVDKRIRQLRALTARSLK